MAAGSQRNVEDSLAQALNTARHTRVFLTILVGQRELDPRREVQANEEIRLIDRLLADEDSQRRWRSMSG